MLWDYFYRQLQLPLGEKGFPKMSMDREKKKKKPKTQVCPKQQESDWVN